MALKAWVYTSHQSQVTSHDLFLLTPAPARAISPHQFDPAAAAAAPSEADHVLSRCGLQVEEGNRFCQACGQEVGAAVAAAPVAAARSLRQLRRAPGFRAGAVCRILAALCRCSRRRTDTGHPVWIVVGRFDFHVWRTWHDAPPKSAGCIRRTRARSWLFWRRSS